MSKGHIPFPSIGGFANMVKYRDRFRSKTETATIGTKIKLHGTNAAIRVANGEIKAQSRKRDATLDSDNYGFANWVDTHQGYFADLVTDTSIGPNCDKTMLVYGEWAGQGIQQTVSVSQLPKSFYVFAMAIMSSDGSKEYILEPEQIAKYIDEQDDMFILPWFKDPVKLHFDGSANTTEDVAQYLNDEVAKIDVCDTYIKSMFDVEGGGEGLVGYNLDDPSDTGFWFKVKGAKHTVNDEAKIAKVTKRAGQEYHDLAEAFLTEGRFQQAMTDSEYPLVFEKQWTGKFLSWVMQDIMKESADERAELDIEWRLWADILSKGAREWFLAKCDET